MDKYINKVINSDCLKILKELLDNSVDLCLTDPPYGLNTKMNGGTWGIKYNHSDMKEWDYVLSPEYIKEIIRVSKNQIIWGGNNYQLPPSRCWLAWIKPNLPTLSDFELAWTSFDKVCKKFKGNRVSFEKLHPTQKPIELMKWCLLNYSKENDLILDPFLGSGTTAVAAQNLHRRFIGIELDPKYCEIARQRLRQKTLL